MSGGQDLDKEGERTQPASISLESNSSSELSSNIVSPTLATGLRWISAACGVLALCALGFIGEGDLANRLAQLALVAVAFATSIGWWQLSRSIRVLGLDRTR